MGWQIKTNRGYEYGEVISALQKSIRRSEEEHAMYWALEIFPQYSKALWVRLLVIVNEDVGLACPETIVLIDALHRQFYEVTKEGSRRLILANAILSLCRAPKSRLADHFQCVINQRRVQMDWNLPMPDYALDKHTLVGKQWGRSWDHWLEEGCFLANNDKTLFDPYVKEAKKLWSLSKPQKQSIGRQRKERGQMSLKDYGEDEVE